MMPPRRTPNITRLSDHFGQYVLKISCPCGHTRVAQPTTLAAIAGWEATLADVSKRLRCSKCGERRCVITARSETKRDG